MIHVTAEQTRLLRAAIEAGDKGLTFRSVRLSRDFGMSDALNFVVDGLLTADEHEERLYITEKGRAFAVRTSA